MWLDVLKQCNEFLPVSLAETAVSLQAEETFIQRGLGWALWSPDPTAMIQPFSQTSFGHTGFTGTSLIVDPTKDLVVACLTNEVANGRTNRTIGLFRRQLHQQIVTAFS